MGDTHRSHSRRQAILNIIAFGGRIGAGKSTISREVAQRLAVPRVAFGDVVRGEARQRNLPDTREALQNLGDVLIAEGWDAFCARVVATADPKDQDTLVVDGVRHIGALEGLAKLAARSFTLVFIDAPWDRRLSWRGIAAEELQAADAHPNEAEVDRVRDGAKLVVMNDGTLEDAITQVLGGLALQAAGYSSVAATQSRGSIKPPRPRTSGAA